MNQCPHCGGEVQAGAPVCPHCSQQLSAQGGPPPPPGYPPGGQPTKTSGMAIASLVLGILGFCSGGLLGLVGLILGIVSISKVNKSAGQMGGKGLAIAGTIAGGVSLLLWLLLLGLSVPNFMKMMAKSKQSEAKVNLGAIFTVQMMYHGENNTYADSFDKIGWKPEGQNLYTYYLADDSIPSKKGKDPPYDLPYDVRSRVEILSFTAVAVGNIDGDETLDVWTIDDVKRLRNVRDDTTH